MPSHETSTSALRRILSRGRVMPILTIHDVATAAPLARSLVAGGIRVFEVVLRTAVAFDAIREMKAAAPEADVGMGTLLTPRDVEKAVAAGASFGVSPGVTDRLADAVAAHGLPFLPGVATPSEVMAACERGFDALKYFPANGVAGIAFLQALAPVFPNVVFCPTGGIRREDVSGYLKLPNCPIVGGSWVTPPELVMAGDWPAITALAGVADSIGP